MTILYITDIINEISDAYMSLIRVHFNRVIVDRINNSSSMKKKLRQLTSRMMLIKIFKILDIDSNKLKYAYYNKTGKFIIPNIEFNISISYCENKVVCGISKSVIGVDIENFKGVVTRERKRLLEQFSKVQIVSAIDFYKTWTKIESIAKTYKRGGLNNLFTDPNFFTRTQNTDYFLLEDKFLIAISLKKLIC